MMNLNCKLLVFPIVLIGAIWLIQNQVFGGKLWRVSNAQKLKLFECKEADFELHQPYKCIYDKVEENLKRSKWIRNNYYNYTIVGMFGFMRHCSRNAEGTFKVYEKIAENFKPGSKINKLLLGLNSSGYEFEKLTQYGANESQLVGQRFNDDFRCFLKELQPQDIKVNCTINRTCHTMDIFLENSVPWFNHLPLDQITQKSLRSNITETFHGINQILYNKIYTQFIDEHIKGTSLFNELKGNEFKLTDTEFDRLIQVLSFLRINQADKTIEDYFDDQKIIKIDLMREHLRYLRFSIGNVAAFNQSAKYIIPEMVETLENSKSGKGHKLNLKFSHDTIFQLIFDSLGWFQDPGMKLRGRGIPMCANFQLVVIKSLDKKINNSFRIVSFQNEELKILFPGCKIDSYTQDFDCFVSKLKRFI